MVAGPWSASCGGQGLVDSSRRAYRRERQGGVLHYAVYRCSPRRPVDFAGTCFHEFAAEQSSFLPTTFAGSASGPEAWTWRADSDHVHRIDSIGLPT